jgi:hypothetical protein
MPVFSLPKLSTVSCGLVTTTTQLPQRKGRKLRGSHSGGDDRDGFHSFPAGIKHSRGHRHQWLMPVILATQETEIRRIRV